MAQEVKTTCPYCGVGCGVIARVGDDGAVSVKGDPEHPANFGRLCSKGSALAETLDLDGRLLHPEIGGRRAGWSEALDLVAERFSHSIANHGPDSVAFYVSGQLLTEDYYIANKLMKGFIGSANIDTNSRLCMSSSVAGHRRAFGSDTVPGVYEDLELADLVVLTAPNLAWCHPVALSTPLRSQGNRPEMKIVVIDPRRTMTADIATCIWRSHRRRRRPLQRLLAHPRRKRCGRPELTFRITRAASTGVAAASRLDPRLSKTNRADAEQLHAFFRLFETTEKVVTCYKPGG